MKKALRWVLFLSLTLAFASQLMAAEIMGQIAVFNEKAGWIAAATAQQQTQILLDELKLTKDIQVLGEADLAKWAEANTDDGNLDTIILFGDFPGKLYAAGNAEPEDSVAEIFLEGGDMILNSGDYIFYINNGAGANGDAALKNMTDSAFSMWTDGMIVAPTDDGLKYTPSLPKSITAPRCFVTSQIEADDDWELEMSFAEAAGNSDPAIIRNLSYGGRVGIFFQESGAQWPRGMFLAEMFNNWLKEKVKSAAVDPQSKLSTTWATVKNDL